MELKEKVNKRNDYLKVSNAEIKALLPEIPVGGRLRFFLGHWEKITDDQWVLSVIKEGYKIEFNQIPPKTGIKKTNVPAKNLDILNMEVKSLIEKGAVEHVPLNDLQNGFYSTFFQVPKKTGDMRPVINLRPLNRYLRKQHFKMDSLTTVLNLVKQGDWAISLDLKDAYMHIPIFKNHRKYLRFCVKNNPCLQFTALPFGPTSAPRVFTKVVSVVAAHLRAQGIRIVVYLDDWFIINQHKTQLLSDRETILNLLINLGFMINVKKSTFTPTQKIVYIGAMFHLDRGLVFPTQERVTKLLMTTQKIMNMKMQTAREFLQLLGIMASCIEIIPNARLYMRPLQIHLLSFWKPSSQKLDQKIPVTKQLKSHLKWWSNSANITKGRSLQHWESNVTITTDASTSIGWGGHMGSQIVQGTWSDIQKRQHINCLEMEAVMKTIQHFLKQLKDKNVLLRCDNSTVVQYINKQGGTKSIQLCLKTWDLWHLLIQNRIQLRAAHIAGKSNTLADLLSRTKIRHTEWTLEDQIVHQIFQKLGTPMIDLFASIQNRKRPIFCTWVPHQEAYALDALSIPWNNLFGYAYPPICLIPKILHHMNQYQCQIILVAPHWPRRPWYPDLLKMIADYPIKLPDQKNLLHQPNTNIYHPNPEIFNLVVWPLSTNCSRREVFLKKLKPHVCIMAFWNTERLFREVQKILWLV